MKEESTETQLTKRIIKIEKFIDNFYVWIIGVMLFLFIWETLLIIIPELLKYFETANKEMNSNIILVIVLIFWTFYKFALSNIGADLEH